ncbi:sigma-70 family RNA polymerase sigma factor [Aureibacillus halotolerans]|uniref:DNA-directed RNA polymerase n=1 Tax=Aureibacillus halotolerans TaxID=1508390 RepID=A0A4R6U9T0_9BACI|nr:sigma-70 family RNA polymerase sigma factor [Aureibacillus halotolerans]TDQ42586.1 DNA-directed RNA polymerase [Aureibacillus halotolerans]
MNHQKDEQTFECVLEKYTPLIRNGLAKLHIHHHADRDEFFQIGRLALWEAWQHHKIPDHTFPAYAKQVVQGRMLDELRRRSKYKRIVETVKNDPLQIHVLHERPCQRSTFEKLLSDLSPSEKCWAMSALWEGLTTREIAEQNDVSMDAVKKWRQRARQKLQVSLSFDDLF